MPFPPSQQISTLLNSQFIIPFHTDVLVSHICINKTIFNIVLDASEKHYVHFNWLVIYLLVK